MLDQLESAAEGPARRTFVIRLWRDREDLWELRGEAQRVGAARPIYIRSLDELLAFIQAEASDLQGKPTAGTRPSGLR